jgi:hypothetical protein
MIDPEKYLKWFDRRILTQTFDVGDYEIYTAIHQLIEKFPGMQKRAAGLLEVRKRGELLDAWA